jgi:hydrogenase nickel incorporation protein HypA/HybF
MIVKRQPLGGSDSSMHELSIAVRIIELVEQEVTAAGGGQVQEVTLRVGSLAGVSVAALEFAFEQARQHTLAASATLSILELPVQVYCPACEVVAELVRVPPLACPRCGRPTADLRQGQELELESITLGEAGGE